MTETERMQYAKIYIDKLANGINPLDGSALPDSDIVNNVHISRCLFYVSGLLDEVIDKKRGKQKKRLFTISEDEAAKFEFSDKGISVSEITGRINAVVDLDVMKKLSYKDIVSWLININMLEEYTDESGKIKKRPTQDGNAIGITTELRFGKGNAPYTVVLYDRNAQQFIIDNIQSIVSRSQ